MKGDSRREGKRLAWNVQILIVVVSRAIPFCMGVSMTGDSMRVDRGK